MTESLSQANIESDPYVACHPQTLPFWRAAASGQFLVPRCSDCRRSHWYPRPFCPFCASESVAWLPSSGVGRIYAFSRLRRDPRGEIIAYVQLEEGPVMMTVIVDATFAELAIGDVVHVAFRDSERARAFPVFVVSRGATHQTTPDR